MSKEAYAWLGGAVLTAVLIIVVGRRLISPAIRLVQAYAASRPHVRAVLVPVADALYPKWRRHAQRSYPYQISWRIDQLRSLKRRRFVIVGAVYLDIQVWPTDAVHLDNQEYSNLDSLNMRCGGGAYYIGYYLNKRYRQRSTLYSSVGRGDRFSAVLYKLLRRERWATLKLARPPRTQCGISVHLFQRDRGFYTTFTHIGSLANLGWRQIIDKLKLRTELGGVLFISGYFRTNLSVDLTATLRRLSPLLLICIDHGRFLQGENQGAESALTDAFSNRLVDVYICTYKELCEFMHGMGFLVDPIDPTQRAANLTGFAKQDFLPPITVVRDRDGPVLTADLVVNGSVTSFSRESPQRIGGTVGSKNAFNAAFVYTLAKSRPDVAWTVAVEAAAVEALTVWAELASGDMHV